MLYSYMTRIATGKCEWPSLKVMVEVPKGHD